MDFCQIVPLSYLEPLKNKLNRNNVHLLLAHLVESSDKYNEFYKKLKFDRSEHPSGSNTPAKTFIMDNAGFEMYRQGLPFFPAEKLIDLGRKVYADYIVLPDYPGRHFTKTIEAAIEYAPKFREAGIKTFFAPQSEAGKIEDYIASFAWAASSPLIDYIGLSILAIPIAYGVDTPGNIQVFGSRLSMVEELYNRTLISLAKANGKKIHFLGMTDGPKEIVNAARYTGFHIDSWDSSAAVWAGIQDVPFDNSPTGLINGKIHKHVDFDIEFDEGKLPLIHKNIEAIQKYTSMYNHIHIPTA